jgi:hypothetical protein
LRTRATLAIALSASLATSGCTSKEMVPTAARYALAQTTTGDFIRLPTVAGGFVEVGPSATFTIDEEVVTASNLYWSDWGLFRKTGEPIARWDDIRSIRVEQLDGAATVAVAATVAIVVVALAALLKGGGGNGRGSGGKGGSGGGGGGKGGGGGGSGRSAPNPSPIIPDPRYTEVAFRTLEAVSSTSQGPGVTVGATEEDETTSATPLFARGARRRANIRVLARLDGGACWPGSRGDCIVSGGRIGVRLIDIFELTGGVRVESNAQQSNAMAVFGAMLHGESPAAHWFALAVGASVAFDATHAHVVPQIAARFRPFRNAGFWLGVVPVEPVYATETDTWSMASGVEITGEF